MQQATRAPPVERRIEQAPPAERLSTPADTHSLESFLIPQNGTEINEVDKTRECSISRGEPLELPLQASTIALATKPTYQLQMSYGPATMEIHLTARLLDTGAGLKLISSSVISHERRNGMK